MKGRVRANETIIDADYTYGYIQSLVTLYFPDPRYYDYTVQYDTNTTISVANAGWATTCPTIVIATPTATSGTISTSTDYINFANINTSKNIIINLLDRSITQNATPARNLMVGGSTWPSVPANTTLSFVSTIGTMAMTWQNAYI